MTQPVQPVRLISVVIPTYQRAHLLRDVIEPLLSDSVISEIIIVDDGSEDSTPEVCIELAKTDSRIRIIRQENAGQAAALTTGANAATSDIVLFLDDDVVSSTTAASCHLQHHQRAIRPMVVLGYMPPHPKSPRRPGDFPIYIYAGDYERVCKKYDADPSCVLTDLWGGHFSVRREIFLATDAVPRKADYHQDQVLGWSLRRLGCFGVFDRSLEAEHKYSRLPDQFFNDCRRSGRSLAQIQSLGIAPPDLALDPCSGIAPPVKMIVRVVANCPRPVTGFLYSLLSISGRLHWWTIETFLARILRLVESWRAFTVSSAE